MGGLRGPDPGWERGVQRVPACPPQLSHDANETLPLHLYVKSYGKNVDSKLQGKWGEPRGWPGSTT